MVYRKSTQTNYQRNLVCSYYTHCSVNLKKNFPRIIKIGIHQFVFLNRTITRIYKYQAEEESLSWHTIWVWFPVLLYECYHILSRHIAVKEISGLRYFDKPDHFRVKIVAESWINLCTVYWYGMILGNVKRMPDTSSYTSWVYVFFSGILLWDCQAKS